MYLFLAGQAQEAKDMKYRGLYRHVLFSFFVYSKRNFRQLAKKKRRQIATYLANKKTIRIRRKGTK